MQPSNPPILLPPSLERVLVVMVNPNLGNCVFALPTIEALCRYFPGGVDVLVDEPYLPLMEMLPSIGRVLAYPRALKGRQRGFRSAGRYARLLRTIIGGRYQAVLDIGGGITSVNVVAASLSKRRIGFAGNRRSAIYSTRLDWNGHEHIYPRYGSMLRCIGQNKTPPQIRLQPGPDVMGAVSDRLAQCFEDPARRLAVIHPGAGYDFRRWPEERFAETAARLAAEYNLNVAVIGAGGETDLMQRVVHWSGCSGQVAPVSLPLQELTALFHHASLMIANESGPTHLAATTPVPIITLFGPSLEARWAPVRDHGITILRGADCDPSCRWGACVRDWACLLNTTVDDVLNAARPHL